MPINIKVITPSGSEYTISMGAGSNDHDICTTTVVQFMRHVYGTSCKYICEIDPMKITSRMTILYTQLLLLHECIGVPRLNNVQEKLEKVISKNYHAIDPEDKCKLYDVFPFEYLRTLATLD